MTWAHRLSIAIYTVAFGLTIMACEREERRFRETPLGTSPRNVRLSEIQPGPAVPTPLTAGPYADNAYEIAEGKRL